jgi:hypothetical protein
VVSATPYRAVILLCPVTGLKDKHNVKDGGVIVNPFPGKNQGPSSIERRAGAHYKKIVQGGVRRSGSQSVFLSSAGQQLNLSRYSRRTHLLYQLADLRERAETPFPLCARPRVTENKLTITDNQGHIRRRSRTMNWRTWRILPASIQYSFWLETTGRRCGLCPRRVDGHGPGAAAAAPEW